MANGLPEELKVAAETLKRLFTKVRDSKSHGNANREESLNPLLTLLILFAKHPYLPILFPIYIYCPDYKRARHWTALKVLLQIPIPLGTVGYAFAQFKNKSEVDCDPHPDVFKVPTGTVSIHDLLFKQEEHVSIALRDSSGSVVGLLAVGSKRPNDKDCHWDEPTLRELCKTVDEERSELLRAIDDFRLAEEESLNSKILELVEERPAEGIERLLFDMQAMAESAEDNLAYHPFWNLGITGLVVDPGTVACYPQRMPDLPPVSSHLLVPTGEIVLHPRLSSDPPSEDTCRFEGDTYKAYRCYADAIAMAHFRYGNTGTALWSDVEANSWPELSEIFAKIAAAPQTLFPFQQYVISYSGNLEPESQRTRAENFATFLNYSYPLQRLILNLILMTHLDRPVVIQDHPWINGHVTIREVEGRPSDFDVFVGDTNIRVGLTKLPYTGPRDIGRDLDEYRTSHSGEVEPGHSAHVVRLWWHNQGETGSIVWHACANTTHLSWRPTQVDKHTCPHQLWSVYMQPLNVDSWAQLKYELQNVSSLTDARHHFPLELFTAFPASGHVPGGLEGDINNVSIGRYLARLVRLHCARYTSRRQMLQNAITSIITESFSHNVAAHALEGLCSRLQDPRKAAALLSDRDDSRKRMAAFMRYLIEKADFWTSPQRGAAEGVTITTWYDLLSEINGNPLFWGTVNVTEAIKTVNVFISFTDGVGRTLEDRRLFTIRTMSLAPEEVPDDGLRALLASDLALVALPGKSSGKQAFLTIVENVLRNAKHCNIPDGALNLHLCISSQRSTRRPEVPWWDVEIYLDHEPFSSSHEPLKPGSGPIVDAGTGKPIFGGGSQGLLCAAYLFCFTYDLVDSRFLWYSTGTGHLKCCFPWIITAYADRDEGKRVFVTNFRIWRGAWIGPAASLKSGWSESDSSGPTSHRPMTGTYGLITIRNSKGGGSLEVIDQVRRYGLFIARTAEEKDELLSLGIVRVVRDEQRPPDFEQRSALLQYFRRWLADWLDLAARGTSELLLMSGENATLRAFGNLSWTATRGHEPDPPDHDSNSQFMRALHGEHNNVRSRSSEKTFRNWLVAYRGDGLAAKMYLKMAADNTVGPSRTFVGVIEDEFIQLRLIEALQTSILVVDERLAVELKPLDMVMPTREWDTWTTLRLQVFDERELTWQQLVTRIGHIAATPGGLHFLVVHLQYLEVEAKKQTGQGGKEQRVQESEGDPNGIARLIQNLRGADGRYPFRYLVVTTGRGRMGWYDALKATGVNLLFMPPAAIASAVSVGVQSGDDLDVKLVLATRLLGY